MLNEKLKEIAEANSYIYKIGAEHWQNLLDAEDDTDKPFNEKNIYILFFNEREEEGMSQFGTLQTTKITGRFLLAVRSRLDDASFEYKYDNHIQPLIALAKTIRQEQFTCLDDLKIAKHTIEAWREDYLDTNLDCVEVAVELVSQV